MDMRHHNRTESRPTHSMHSPAQCDAAKRSRSPSNTASRIRHLSPPAPTNRTSQSLHRGRHDLQAGRAGNPRARGDHKIPHRALRSGADDQSTLKPSSYWSRSTALAPRPETRLLSIAGPRPSRSGETLIRHDVRPDSHPASPSWLVCTRAVISPGRPGVAAAGGRASRSRGCLAATLNVCSTSSLLPVVSAFPQNADARAATIISRNPDPVQPGRALSVANAIARRDLTERRKRSRGSQHRGGRDWAERERWPTQSRAIFRTRLTAWLTSASLAGACRGAASTGCSRLARAGSASALDAWPCVRVDAGTCGAGEARSRRGSRRCQASTAISAAPPEASWGRRLPGTVASRWRRQRRFDRRGCTQA